MSTEVQLTIDGVAVTTTPGTTIFDAARTHGIPIPTLCHQQNETPVGVCRVCVVEAGGRVLSAACVRPVENGMNVSTDSEKVRSARRTVVELLMSDHPSPCARQRQTHDCELEALAGYAEGRFANTPGGFFALIHPGDLVGLNEAVDRAVASGDDAVQVLLSASR